MPLVVTLSAAEADFASKYAHQVEGVSIKGQTLTYNPAKTVDLLAACPKDDVSYVPLAGRLAAVAAQVGLPNVIFQAPSPAPVAPEPVKEPSPAPAAPQEPPAATPAVSSEPSEDRPKD